MNVIKKMIVALIVLIATFSTNVSAQDFVNFQSTETGICVTVSKDAKVIKHDETILHLQSELATFSAHPMFTENLTDEALLEGMSETAEAAGFDLSKMESDEFNHKTVDIVIYSGTDADGVSFGVGIIKPKDNDKIIFLMTLTFVDGAGDVEAGNIINSIEFDPNVIE